MIHSFLQRFPSLELFAVDHIAMNTENFKQLQQQYRYRTRTIVTKPPCK